MPSLEIGKGLTNYLAMRLGVSIGELCNSIAKGWSFAIYPMVLTEPHALALNYLCQLKIGVEFGQLWLEYEDYYFIDDVQEMLALDLGQTRNLMAVCGISFVLPGFIRRIDFPALAGQETLTKVLQANPLYKRRLVTGLCAYEYGQKIDLDRRILVRIETGTATKKDLSFIKDMALLKALQKWYWKNKHQLKRIEIGLKQVK